METASLVKGIEILLKYRKKPGYDIGADHDVIYLYPADERLSDDDIEVMIGLGFIQDVDQDGGDFAFKDYMEEESWYAEV